MSKRKQFDHWRDELMPGAPRRRRGWPRLGAGAGLGLLVGAVAVVGVWFMRAPGPVPLAVIEPQVRLVQIEPVPVFSSAATAIDPSRVRRVAVSFFDPTEGAQVAYRQVLYESAAPVRLPGGQLATLAQLNAPGGQPFSGPLDLADLGRYQLVMEAESFAAAQTDTMRFFAQPSFRDLERRQDPWPVWIESPPPGAVVSSPFPIKVQAYQDGFVQIRVRPRLWAKYYLKPERQSEDEGDVRPFEVRAGQSIRLEAYEGGAEGFEIYALFAHDPKYLPRGEQIDSLPQSSPNVVIVGPRQIAVRDARGPVRTNQELENDLEFATMVAARFTRPDQKAAEAPAAGPPEVTRLYTCSGEVSTAAAKQDLRYVLGVRVLWPLTQDLKGKNPGHHIWVQSEPWKTEDGRFEGKLAKFGVPGDDVDYAFELWLIAIRPGADVRAEERIVWLASALPEGCVRVATVEVHKPVSQTDRPAPGEDAPRDPPHPTGQHAAAHVHQAKAMKAEALPDVNVSHEHLGTSTARKDSG